jgi:predicted NBD/HSP70 family sugar kinase
MSATRARATVRDLRRVNRTAVLRRLFLGGPLNRLVLAQLTGLSGGSITNVVSELLDEGLVVEAGLEESDGGRPRTLLRINSDFGVVVGIDVGETGIRVEGFDLSMREIAGAAVPLHPQHHDAATVIEHIAAAVEQVHLQFAREGRRALGVGIALPGVVEQDGGDVRVHAPNIGWDDIPLVRILSERVGLPVFAENGAKTLGQAEMWLGAGRGTEHAVVTLWGTGVGAAIFTNGTLYRGVASSAGEWGHASIVVGGKSCRCGGSGCLEAYIGAEALLDEWARVDSRLKAPSDPDAEEWVDRFLAEAEANAAVARVLDQTATYFGVAAANLANLFNPERIIVGGWLGLRLGPTLLPRIRAVVGEQALGYPAARMTVELGQLGTDAVAMGASTLVVEQLLASGGRAPAPVSRRGRPVEPTFTL